MFASTVEPRARRRGIVLVVVLGMLGLMALIGVTFATFAGQSLIASRNFGQGVGRPQAEALMDYALAQLINDTNNPVSALRGHSLLRDMYGNDSTFRGANPTVNAVSETGGVLSSVYVAGSGNQTLHFTGYQLQTSNASTGATTSFYNQYQYQTNIPTTGQYYGMDFTRWLVRFPYNGVPQTFEILEDDFSGGTHLLTLAGNLINSTIDPTVTPASPTTASAGDWTSFIYADPNLGATVSPGSVSKGYSSLGKEVNTANGGLSPANPSAAFVLDGRYMRAFNGSGLTQPANPGPGIYPYNLAAYGNFRVNGSLLNVGNTAFSATLGDPDSVGMDEDYDACDLENWFLAIQSADGQVVIPSFHRPGILTAADWLANSPNVPLGNVGPNYGNPKILRPRQADNSPLFPPDPSVVDATTGKLTYDIDNDGDGVTDSVWVDLGYPVQRDPGGKLYKPLFAFMILGTNGRLPLNTAGNLQARAIGNQINTRHDSSGETIPPATVPVPSSMNTATGTADATTQVPQPGAYLPTTTTPDNAYFQPMLSSQTYLDAPLWDHTSHLGYSVNEINPKFALQNAPSNVYADSGNLYLPTTSGPYGVYPRYTTSPTLNGNDPLTSYTQHDNAGMNVALTQLRNILAGTVPTDVSNPLTYANISATTGAVTTSSLPTNPTNQDLNYVVVNGVPYVLPNNVADGGDNFSQNTSYVQRLVNAVPGRWGEVSGVPRILPLSYNNPTNNNPAFTNPPILYPGYWYNNPVRAGRSFFNAGTNDAMDDDYDALDPFLAGGVEVPTSGYDTNSNGFSLEAAVVGNAANQYQIPLGGGYTGSYSFYRTYPESVDLFDPAGQRAVASERIRTYATPIDPSGSGRIVGYLDRPKFDQDFGTGADPLGRTSYFRYFRPAGMPQEVRYPYANAGVNFPYPYSTNSGLGQQYLMPVLLPAGYSTNAAAPASLSDVSNNRTNGFQSRLTPPVTATHTAQAIASMGTLPYDWDMNGTPGAANMPSSPGPANGYALTYDPATSSMKPSVTLVIPTIAPSGPLQSVVNTSWGPKLASPPANYVVGYPTSVVNGYLGSAFVDPRNTNNVYTGGGGLNIDEADEMNLYVANPYDLPYGPSDLEWLYRLQDVDGATLASRLSKLAPVSFLNPADGLTRRRLFSTDSWDLNRFAYANDNPAGNYTFNSRFLPYASASLENMNQVVQGGLSIANTSGGFNPAYANPIATEFLPNPTFAPTSLHNDITNFVPNQTEVTSPTPLVFPLALTPNSMTSLFDNARYTATTSNGVVVPFGSPSTRQVQTPSIAHGDRRINLNFPLPIANDPAEPVRQKWVRETYQLLKSILPPASVDTPEELAALSQFVVNIIDFRDTDATMTRFVNTDLEVTDVLTKVASNNQAPTLDLTWTVSPSGVKFATTPIPANHFPYDPSIYSPDPTPPPSSNPTGPSTVTSFLVQHGMENNPIALNEAIAYKAQYGTSPGPLMPYQAMFIELVNTLTEELNNPGSKTNASAISLSGWDIVLAPDAVGWGRPDPISGDMNPIATPIYTPNPSGSTTTAPAATARMNYAASDVNMKQLITAIQQYAVTDAAVPANNPIIKGISAGGAPDYFVIGDYRSPGVGGASLPSATVEGNTNAVAKDSEINVRLPIGFAIPTPAANAANYYWVYLRRPANPFDVAPPNEVRPNKEMVVVDAIRFAVVDSSNSTITTPGGPPTRSTNAIFSAERFQPYRGGHLLRVDTTPPAAYPKPATGSPANPQTTISPPSPAYAYGYSEQMGPPPTGNGNGVYSTPGVAGGPATYQPTTPTIQQSINDPNTIRGGGGSPENWSHIPFNDRDFSSVAELLLVPGCPPGLFTKQFIEEAYPGNVFSNMGATATATGTDDRDFLAGGLLVTGATSAVVAPSGMTNPSLVGRKNFHVTNLPAWPSYPYLSDNFYYSAASVTPPSSGSGLDAKYTALTTEIGGWTGAGWHKMLEFFEVPSSANGAIGTADGGNNYDWARSDIKPGLLNINLIIDEEVFAGLVDDPRLNENLAYLTSAVPAVVTQINASGYPASKPINGTTPQLYYVYGQQPMFAASSTNVVYDPTVPVTTVSTLNLPAGRGYTYRDPNLNNYPGGSSGSPTSLVPQQVHGIKAAFSDFLKLRHGGSGYLFAFGGGLTGSGDYPTPSTTPAYPVTQTTPPFPSVTQNQGLQAVAAERPYRSLSFPDINYTILRPASLPPAALVLDTDGTRLQGTYPPLPTTNEMVPNSPPPNYTPSVTVLAGLERLLQYINVNGSPYVQLQPTLAPMNQSLLATPGTNYQYVYDPGLKNPFLPIQYVNKTSPLNTPAGSLPLAPPYATRQSSTAPTIQAAPFPPPIPPTPARRIFQIADNTPAAGTNFSNANLNGGYNSTSAFGSQFPVNEPTVPLQLSTGVSQATPSAPSLVAMTRAAFLPDNATPQAPNTYQNFLGSTGANDYRQHPLYRTEWLQKVMNLTTVRTHQFAVWITVGFFEVVKTGTAELGIPDVLGQELGLTAGRNMRYRSFFTLDRTKATGFNPYYPGNFRDVVTYRRRIE